jgi:hypothetical protein
VIAFATADENASSSLQQPNQLRREALPHGGTTTPRRR